MGTDAQQNQEDPRVRMQEDNSIQLAKTLPKEVVYAQYLVYSQVILGVITVAIFLVMRLGQQGLITILSSLASIGFSLFWLFLGWQLGRLRSWARMILLLLAAFDIIGTAAQLLFWFFDTFHIGFFHPSPNAGNIPYQVYYDGTTVIFAVIAMLLFYLLSRPSVRDIFRT